MNNNINRIYICTTQNYGIENNKNLFKYSVIVKDGRRNVVKFRPYVKECLITNRELETNCLLEKALQKYNDVIYCTYKELVSITR